MRQRSKVLYALLVFVSVFGLLLSGCGSNSGVSVWNLLSSFLMGGSIQGTALNSGGVVTTFAGSAGNWGTIDGTGTDARFNRPYDITTDGTDLYLTDRDNHTVRKIVISTGEVTTLAGTAGISGNTDGTGADARFYEPTGITTDGTNLYVANKHGHTIRKIVISTGEVTTLAGTAGVSGSADGTGTAATFYEPYGITTDGTNLYVADRKNHIIRKIVIATKVVSTLAGAAGLTGTTDGTGADARFNNPRGITIVEPYLYVTDWDNHTIRRINPLTGAVTTFAGTAGVNGTADGTGTAARFYRPRGITSDGTNLYVADYWNNTIRKIVISSAIVSTLAGSGAAGSADGTALLATFDEPSGITTDGRSLFVTDNANDTIRKID